MSKEQRNVPKLRFPEFTGEWIQHMLSDEFSDFIVPMRDKPKEFGGTIPWTRIEDIEGKYLNGTLSDQYVTEETIKKMNLRIIPKDSLIVSSSATFGIVAVVTQDLITNQTFIGLVPNEKSTLDFWYSYFQSDGARAYMKLQSAGSTIFYIARESFEKMPVRIPPKAEAIRIGALFANVDTLISLQQRKLDQIKEYKKGMLQKMFPKEGKSVPEVRFPGFTGEWERRKLGDVLEDLYNGQTPSRVQTSYWNGDINWLTSGELNRGIVYTCIERITKKGQESAHLKIIPRGTFVMAITGLEASGTRGNCAILGIDTTLNQSCMALMPDPSLLSTRFLFQWYKMVGEEYGTRFTQGTKQQSYNAEIIKSLDIVLPSVKEQEQISDVLVNLDTLISLHQRKLEAMKEYKKGLLQQMFI